MRLLKFLLSSLTFWAIRRLAKEEKVQSQDIPHDTGKTHSGTVSLLPAPLLLPWMALGLTWVLSHLLSCMWLLSPPPLLLLLLLFFVPHSSQLHCLSFCCIMFSN